MNIKLSIKLGLCALLLTVTMAASLWFVIQDNIWLAPPYLFNSVHIKFWLLFTPLPILLFCMWFNRHSLGLPIVSGGLGLLIIAYFCSALIAFMGFIVSRSVPYASFCESFPVAENSVLYTCTVHPWIDARGEWIHKFEHTKGSIFMYKVDHQWKSYKYAE
jgi:hypothetical protein